MSAIKKQVLWALGTLVVGALMFGPAKLALDLRAAKHRVDATIDDLRPVPQQIASIEILLKDLVGQIIRADEFRDDVQAQFDQSARLLEEKQKYLVQAEAGLARRLDRYEIGGRTYPREVVEADARRRLDECRMLTVKVDGLRPMVAQSADSAAKLRQLRQARTADLELLQARYSTAEIQRQVASLVNATMSTLGPKTELEANFSRLDKQVSRIEREVRMADRATGDGLVDYEGSKQSNVTEDIRVFFSQGSTAKNGSIVRPAGDSATRPGKG